MKWIKASERLPSKEGLYHYKEETGLNDVVFYSHKLGFYKPVRTGWEGEGIFRKLTFENKPINKPLEIMLWLDELVDDYSKERLEETEDFMQKEKKEGNI